MIKVGIIGASGYTGAELMRLIAGHPAFELKVATSRTFEGKSIAESFPQFAGEKPLYFSGTEDPQAVADCDLVFLAMPHGMAMELVPGLLAQGKKVIDLGADYRFRTASTYEEWYKIPHKNPELCVEAVYGLPELQRESIKKASLVANPGCYPTSVLLALAPLGEVDWIDRKSIIIDSKSGVSGAGRGAKIEYLYGEINENLRAYGIPNHRHTPEIEQGLSEFFHEPVVVSFTPHLVPMTRGILSTIHLKLKKEINASEILDLYKKFYTGEKFVRVLSEGVLPQTKAVYGSNYIQIGLVVDRRTQQLIVVSAIDNLVKGASRQAIQNANLMCGFPEDAGLAQLGIYP